jgi:hypothetical protein
VNCGEDKYVMEALGRTITITHRTFRMVGSKTSRHRRKWLLFGRKRARKVSGPIRSPATKGASGNAQGQITLWDDTARRFREPVQAGHGDGRQIGGEDRAEHDNLAVSGVDKGETKTMLMGMTMLQVVPLGVLAKKSGNFGSTKVSTQHAARKEARWIRTQIFIKGLVRSRRV